MAKLHIVRGSASNILRVFLQDSSSSVGAGLTGLTFSSTGLSISYIREKESAATTYTAAGSTIETITTLGTFATPTATKCRFKEVDATNLPGLYEIQFDDAVFNATGTNRTIHGIVKGATNLAPCPFEIQLQALDTQDSASFGSTILQDLDGIGPIIITMNDTVIDIKAKTDNLPPDPADASDIAAEFVTVNSKLDAIDDYVDTEVAAIKAKTDNLPSDPADASDIAAAFSTVNTKLDAINDYVDTEVAAIKAKTDNLPSDPADASDIASAFSALNTKVDTIDDFLDTEIAAIKSQTDQLVFTSGKVHAQVKGMDTDTLTADALAADAVAEIAAAIDSDCPTVEEIAAEVDDVLSSAHGSGEWDATGSFPTADEIATAVNNKTLACSNLVGTVEEESLTGIISEDSATGVVEEEEL